MPESLTVQGVIPQIGLADRLLIARRHAALNQGQLARLIGISPRSVYAAEDGRTRPRRPVLLAWAMATGVSLEWICEGDRGAVVPAQVGRGMITCDKPGVSIPARPGRRPAAGRPGRGPRSTRRLTRGPGFTNPYSFYRSLTD